MSSGLRVATVFIGIALCALSIMLNFQLYTSLVGSSNIEKFSYQYIGIALDFSKIVCLLLAVFLWFAVSTAKSITLGVFCFIFYVFLSGISLSAGWGFGLKSTANGENERLKSSMAMQSLQSQVQNAESKASQYSGYANVDTGTIQSQLTQLNNELKGLQSDLAKCPHNWLTKCIRPTRDKIEAKQSEILPLKQQLDGYNAYQGALSHQSELMGKMGNLDSSSLQSQIFHPLFIATGDLFDVSPQQAKQGLLLVSFVCLELLGSLFFAVGIMFNGQVSYGNNAQPVMGFMPKNNGYNGIPLKTQKSFNTANLDTSDTVKQEDERTTQPVKVEDKNPPLSKKEKDTRTTLKEKKPLSDTGVDGENSARYQAIKKAVLSKEIKPTLKAIMAFKFGNMCCNRNVAKSYQAAMQKEGLIKPYTLRNGKQSFQIA